MLPDRLEPARLSISGERLPTTSIAARWGLNRWASGTASLLQTAASMSLKKHDVLTFSFAGAEAPVTITRVFKPLGRCGTIDVRFKDPLKAAAPMCYGMVDTAGLDLVRALEPAAGQVVVEASVDSWRAEALWCGLLRPAAVVERVVELAAAVFLRGADGALRLQRSAGPERRISPIDLAELDDETVATITSGPVPAPGDRVCVGRRSGIARRLSLVDDARTRRLRVLFGDAASPPPRARLLSCWPWSGRVLSPDEPIVEITSPAGATYRVLGDVLELGLRDAEASITLNQGDPVTVLVPPGVCAGRLPVIPGSFMNAKSRRSKREGPYIRLRNLLLQIDQDLDLRTDGRALVTSKRGCVIDPCDAYVEIP